MVRKGEIVDRFDTTYYSALNTLDIANNTTYPVRKLSEVAFLQRGKFSHRPRNDERFYNGEYPFIQTGDIVKASQNNDTIIFTQTLNKLGLSVSKLFQPDILIITIAANIGDTAILTYPACFPDSLVTITPKISEVSVRYLNVYFKYVKDYLVNLAPQSAQKNINLQQLSPTPVVIPPPEIQAEIISIFENAYTAKKQKEAEATALLASIDGYLLQELGITLPPPSEKKTYFLTRSSQVSGGRFDANIYNENRVSAIKAIENCNLPFKKLKFVANFSKSIVSDSSSLPYIGLENIESNTGHFIETSEKQSFSSAVFFKKNEVLFPKLRPYLNKVYLAEFNGVCSTEFHILNSNVQNLKNEFLAIFLINQIVVSQTKCLMSGNTLPRLQTEDIENLLIPLPPPEKQTEIANHISALRTQAKQLQQRAATELAHAKLHIEHLILGE